MKLPTPPVPKGLRRKPATPGTRPPSNGAHSNGATVQDPKETKKITKQRQREAFKQQAAEVPIAMVGWLDERTGGGPFLRAFLFRKVPTSTNWATSFRPCWTADCFTPLTAKSGHDTSRVWRRSLSAMERSMCCASATRVPILGRTP